MAHGPYHFKHGWIPVDGSGNPLKGKDRDAALKSVGRSADKLAARVGSERVPGHEGYSPADVARLGSGSHLGDSSSPSITHSSHTVGGVSNGHDTLVEHPDSVADLGSSSMGPSAFADKLEHQMDTSDAKAGEHISVEQAKGRMRFAKAATVAALAASVLGFAGAAGSPGGDENAVPDVGLYTYEDYKGAADNIKRGKRFDVQFEGEKTGSVLSGQNKNIVRVKGY